MLNFVNRLKYYLFIKIKIFFVFTIKYKFNIKQ